VTSQFLLIAKAPVAGQVKTRLCPPCTPDGAAAVAAAALADTIEVVDATPARRRTVVHSGPISAPVGWAVVRQRGDGFDERLANAFADTAMPATASILIGMDTPQVTPELLRAAATALGGADAVLGPAEDGGWWLLGLRSPAHAEALRGVPMSTVDTGRLTWRALRQRNLRIALLPTLRDVDTADDALAVAAATPGGRFAEAVAAHVPSVREEFQGAAR